MVDVRPGQPERGSEPWRGDALNRRRWQLFRLAVPVFRRTGFRGSTIKELAHACHMSPATLYYYFPSKAALATFPLNLPMPKWDEAAPEPGADPLVTLREIVDIALAETPDYMLAMDLAREMGRPMGQRELAAAFSAGDSLFGTRITAAAPSLSRTEAIEVARRLVAILVAPYATGQDPESSTTRDRMIDILRLHLIPAGVDPVRFEEIVARP